MAMDELKTTLSKYAKLTKRLNELNKECAELRDARNSLELDLAAIYAHPKEQLPEQIELTNSELIFTVKKPMEWKKGWNLSKKQLREYVLEILPEHGPDLLREIEHRHEKKLVVNDFGFEMKPIEVKK